MWTHPAVADRQLIHAHAVCERVCVSVGVCVCWSLWLCEDMPPGPYFMSYLQRTEFMIRLRFRFGLRFQVVYSSSLFNIQSLEVFQSFNVNIRSF